MRYLKFRIYLRIKVILINTKVPKLAPKIFRLNFGSKMVNDNADIIVNPG
jgi:hypothetical protein